MNEQIPPDLRIEPVAAFLEHVRDTLGPDAIDELWIFPVQRAATLESIVVVVSAFEPEPERRRVITAHRTTRRPPKGPPEHQDALIEHGVAPSERLGRLVEGVLRRIGDEMASPPYHAEIRGEEIGWGSFLAQIRPAGEEE